MKFRTTLIILLVLLTGCNSQKSNNSSSMNVESNIETGIEPISEETETETTWQSAYRKELIKSMNAEHHSYEIPMFSLYDINDDDIPELFIPTGAYHGAVCNIYTFTDKLILLGGFGSWGTCRFYPDKNILCSGYTGQGVNHSSYYQLDNNGTLLQLAYLCDNSVELQETVYKIDDIEVTEEEYNKVQNNYSDKNSKYLGGDFILNEAFIDAVLNEVTDWKECYKDLLYESQNLDEYYRFSLYDITGDDIPELFISNGANRECSCNIYSFDDRLVSIVKLGTFGTIEYSQSCDLLYNYSIAQGHEHFTYYTLDENNNFKHEMTLYNNVGAAPTEEDVKYKINNEEVSYDEYKNNFDKYKEIDDFISLGRNYKFTEEDILNAISVP